MIEQEKRPELTAEDQETAKMSEGAVKRVLKNMKSGNVLMLNPREA